MTERFDAVVIGGGMSGLPLALRATKQDRVALIEKELLGGHVHPTLSEGINSAAGGVHRPSSE